MFLNAKEDLTMKRAKRSYLILLNLVLLGFLVVCPVNAVGEKLDKESLEIIPSNRSIWKILGITPSGSSEPTSPRTDKGRGRWALSAGGNFGSVSAFEYAGIGTVVRPGGEFFALVPESHMKVTSGEGSIVYEPFFSWEDVSPRIGLTYDVMGDGKGNDRTIWEGVFLEFSGEVFAGDDVVGTRIEPGTNNVAFTYHQPAPNNSTGVFTGANGATGQIKTSIDQIGFEFVVGTNIPINDQWSYRLGIIPIKYEKRDVNHWGSFTSINFPDIIQIQDQETEEHWIGGGIKGEFVFQPIEKVELFAGAGVNILHWYGHLNSTQNNKCGGCPPAEQVHNVTIIQKISDTTYDWHAQGGTKLNLTDRWGLTLKGEYEFKEKAAYVVNPKNPNDPSPTLKSDSSDIISGSVSLNYTF